MQLYAVITTNVDRRSLKNFIRQLFNILVIIAKIQLSLKETYVYING